MYKSFRAREFRCFEDLDLSELERVNLITGKNNAGKTALLESLFIHGGAYNPELVFRVNAFRGIEPLSFELRRGVETPWNWIFRGLDTSRKVELKAKYERSRKRTVRLGLVTEPSELAKAEKYFADPSEPLRLSLSSGAANVFKVESIENGIQGEYYLVLDQRGLRIRPIPPSPPYQTIFLPTRRGWPSLGEDAERYGNLDTEGQQSLVVKALQVIEKRLVRLAVVPIGYGERTQAMLRGDLGSGRLIPLPLMGEGMVRLASLVLAIGNAKGGVVLIDEIENGLHHSVMESVWRVVSEAARQFDAQVFATTHSLECIRAAHKAFSEHRPYDFRLHRLEQVGDKTRVFTYGQETLSTAIESELEVR